MLLLFIRVLLWLGFALLLYWVLLKLIPPKLFTFVGGIVVLILIAFSFYEPTRVVSVPDPIWKLFIFPFKPLGFALILLGVSVVNIFKTSKDKWLKSMVAIAFGFLLLSSMPLANNELVKLYETKTTQPEQQSNENVAAIVLLGQGTTEALFPYGNTVQLTDRGDRLLYAVQLYKEQAKNNPLLIISAGRRDYLKGEDKYRLEAQDIFTILQNLGVPKEKMKIDNASRDIRSSAMNVKKIIEDAGKKDQTLMLITSAIQMRRAKLTFEQLGLKVSPHATDFYSFPNKTEVSRKITIEDLLPAAETLAVTTKVFEDFFGFVYYFLRGWLTPKL